MHIEKSAGVLGGLKGMSDRLPQTFTIQSFFQWPLVPKIINGPGELLRIHPGDLHSFLYLWSLFWGTKRPINGTWRWREVVDWFMEGWLVAYVLSDVVLPPPEVYAFRFYVWIWWCVQSFRDCSNVAYCQWSFWTCTSPAFAPLHRGCFISHFFSTAFKSFRMIFFFRFLQSGSSPRVVIGPFCQSSHPWGLISWNEMELHDS